MSYYKLDQNQFSDFVNLTNKVFYPLTNFVNKHEFLSILDKFTFNKKFFPYPIFFGMSKKDYLKNKNKNKLFLLYKSKVIAEVENLNFFEINKQKFGYKIYGKNFQKHPYFKKFKKENYKFLHFNIKKKYKINLKKKIFLNPSDFSKKIKKKPLASFHTRNVPHNSHIWIHNYLIKKYSSLLIQPLIGQYKKGEYKDDVIMRLNKMVIKKYNSKKIFVIPFFSYPRYGGPREAALHAIVRKNYGCSHFWVGRDHAGYKQFYNKYDSQIFCKQNQSKLNIKIIAEKEPYFCKLDNLIVNKCNCKINCKVSVSGSKIRSFLIRNIKIPEIYMPKFISKNLNKLSLIK